MCVVNSPETALKAEEAQEPIQKRALGAVIRGWGNTLEGRGIAEAGESKSSQRRNGFWRLGTCAHFQGKGQSGVIATCI